MSIFLDLKSKLSKIKDPRVLNRSVYNLEQILVIVVLGIISGCDSFVEIECWANCKKKWLRKVVNLVGNVPSHDTLSRVMSLIEPCHFENAFISWVHKTRKILNKEMVLGIDGKCARGASVMVNPKVCKKLNLVSVFSTDDHLVLAQRRATSTGRPEVFSANELIDLINIRGMTIIGDAGIGTSSFIKKIVTKESDYFFPLKKKFKKNL
ncbi:MAG: transposase ISAs1 family protein [Nitrosarchaeum sp.]|nr:transposase ISAs1 family protein [Nitrosarchaeum sp.]